MKRIFCAHESGLSGACTTQKNPVMPGGEKTKPQQMGRRRRKLDFLNNRKCRPSDANAIFVDKPCSMLKQKISEDKKRMITSAIAYLRFKGYHEIKAPFKEFGDPQAVFNKASDPGFSPDLVAQKDFGTYLFETVENLDGFSTDTYERWNTYIEYAERKNGKFYLIVYSEDVDAVNEKLSSMEQTPAILKIRR